MLKRSRERGDTIVEVLFAVAIFSLVVVGALSLINQGSATSRRALESTLVRQQMDAQAETLRFMHDAYTAAYYPGISFDTTDGEAATSPAEEWYRMMQYVSTQNVTSSTEFGYCPSYTPGNQSSYSPPAGSFFLNPLTARVVARDRSPESMAPAQTWAQLTYTGSDNSIVTSEGMWIEAVRSPDNDVDPYQSRIGYIDFHVRACWDAVGTTLPMHLGTIVRLYEPRD